MDEIITNIKPLGLENPMCSTDDVWRETNMLRCLSDDLNTIESNITALQSGKADVAHVHNNYVTTSDLEVVEDVMATKANADHIHTQYAPTSHTHDNYASQIALDTLGETVSGKADVSHTHTEYVTQTLLDNAVNALESELDDKANVNHSHDDKYYTESEIDSKLSANLTSANAYTDAEIANLLNNSTAAVDSIMELATAMEDNADAIEALESIAANKANATDLTSHTGNKSNPHSLTLAQLGVTATASELNVLDGITATTTELNYVDGVTSNIQTQLNNKAASSHTHSYAGSSSVGGSATSAVKLDTATAGSATQPVYFSGGKPVACTYTLAKSVPANALFSDTTYSVVTTSANGLMSASDKFKLDGMVLATVSEVETYLAI